MRYHLIRHAQTNANSQGRMACENTEVLNDEGHRQALLLSDYLLTQNFDAIWVSPLPRAIATIEPFIKESGGDYQLMPVITEGCFNIDPNAGIATPLYGEDGLPLQDEPVDVFRGRVQSFIDSLLKQEEAGSVLVVTHGQFIREFLNMLLCASRYVRWPVGNCSETLIEIHGDIFIRHVNRDVISQPDAFHAFPR